MSATNLESMKISAPFMKMSGGLLLEAGTTRALLITLTTIAASTTLLIASATATTAAVVAVDPELTRLLRGMALLKALIASGVIAAVLWRLGAPTSKL